MNQENSQQHWDSVHQNKNVEQCSWYQPTPQSSLKLIEQCQLAKEAKIIDIGAGDSFLVDHLLEQGYTDLTVVDISQVALDKAQQRLGPLASKVEWIAANAATFQATQQYDCWHDRAAFHFLTEDADIQNYVQTVSQHIKKGGYLILGTFSTQGPTKCSGLRISQYSEEAMTALFEKHFEKLECFTIDHETPSGSIQNFIFCKFQKK